MNNGSASKNFYSENRTYSRTPSNQNLTQQARMQNSLYSTLQNMQSLQTIKDQIQQLQNTLSTQHRKSSAQKSEVVNKPRDKSSFYGLIREQLKQVNKLQSSSSEIDNKSFKNTFASKINRRQEQQLSSNNSTPNNSVPKSQSLIVTKNSKAQVLKSLLNNDENQSEQYLRKQLQDKLQQLEIQKRMQINEIREKYKEERKQVEQRYQLKLQEELQIFEKKLKKTLMKSEMQQPNSSVFLYIIIAISPSDQQLKTSYHFVNKLSPKSQITSSFKKDCMIEYNFRILQRKKGEIRGIEIQNRGRFAKNMKIFIYIIFQIMGNFLEFFKNNKVVSSIVGIGVVGGVGYGAYQKLSQSMTQSQIMNDTDSTRIRVNQDEEEIDMNRTLYTTVTKTGKMTQIIKGIKVSYVANSQEQCLSPETIMEILKSTIELAGDEYASATRNNRSDRRRARQSKKKNIYLQLITRYNEDCEEILEKAQSQLLLELDIPKDVFEESMLILMDRGFFQQLYMLQASVKQKIKEKIKSTKDINGDLIKKIITYHIQILTNCPEEVKGYITKLQQKPETKDLIPLALNLIIQDLIHEKFGVEEEDQIRCLQKQEIQGDHKINQLLGQIETVMTQFMQSFGLGGMDQLPDSLETFF